MFHVKHYVSNHRRHMAAAAKVISSANPAKFRHVLRKRLSSSFTDSCRRAFLRSGPSSGCWGNKTAVPAATGYSFISSRHSSQNTLLSLVSFPHFRHDTVFTTFLES